MARLRYNGLSTTLGGSLTNVATSVTFAAALTHSNGTNVPTIVSPDYIPLAILGATGHLSEIVYLTAYTAGATTGTIGRGKEGTSGVAHSSGDAVAHAPLVGDITGYGSSQQGILGSAFDILFAQTSSASFTNTLWYVRVDVAAGTSITNVLVQVTSAGTTLTSGQNLLGIYSPSGTLIGSTADQSAVWTSVGKKTAALTGGPFVATGPFVWVGILTNFTGTSPRFASAGSALDTGNAFLTSSTLRFGVDGSVRTSLPASITPSTAMSAATTFYWAGVS